MVLTTSGKVVNLISLALVVAHINRPSAAAAMIYFVLFIYFFDLLLSRRTDFAPDGDSPLVLIVRMLGDGSVQLMFTGWRAGLDYADSVRFYSWQ